MRAHPTARSKLLGIYIQFKGLVWAVMGLVGFIAGTRSPDFWDGSPMRLFAYYLLVFAVPGILIWTCGVLVRYRRSLGWYLGVAYFAALIIGKTGGGVAEIPAQAWYWVSQRVSQGYIPWLQAFGILAAAAFAADIAALLAFVSPRGRDCWHIGKPNRDARG